MGNRLSAASSLLSHASAKFFGFGSGDNARSLVERLLGAKLHLCAAKRYVRYGADMSAMERLNTEAADELRRQGKNPYVVPVGGTTPLGTGTTVLEVGHVGTRT